MKTIIIFHAIGYALLGLLMVNTIYFLIELSRVNFLSDWNFIFKHGTFNLNNKLIGLKLGSPKANGLMLLIFIMAILTAYRKSKLKNKK